MDFNLMPVELSQLIISNYFDIASVKQISLTSKTMNSLAMQRMWAKPRFSKPKDTDFLRKISHLPINELHTKDFKCSFIELTQYIPQLKLLHVDSDRIQQGGKLSFPMISSMRFLKLPLILHTKSLRLFKESDFDEFLELRKNQC